MQEHYNVLFLCTGNSARSILVEAILNFKGKPRFSAYSAGSHPSGAVRPEALKRLEAARIPLDGLRSKGWEEFSQPGAPKLDFVFTVCDNAAKEVCPIWPGQPMTAHWGVPDPAAVRGTPQDVERAYREAFTMLDRSHRTVSFFAAGDHRPACSEKGSRRQAAMKPKLRVRIVAEFLGTGFLVAAVVGSGIMAERLCGGNVGLALLANTIATGAALVALILAFGPISGAHFNPVVSVADAIEGGLSCADAVWYVCAQCIGGVLGTILANAMFALPLVSISQHQRSGHAQLLSEFVAAFGLLAVIWGCSRSRSEVVAFAVATYIMAAYWFTASTSFANPAVTLARSLSNTFAGIRPADVLAFIPAQVAGGLAATFLFRWLVPGLRSSAKNVVVPHGAAE